MKTAFPNIEHSLQEARAAITAQITPLEQQQVPVSQALTRISATPIPAARPKPSYSQSTRDGFALAAQPHATDNSCAEFKIIGETAAGDTEQKSLQPGQTFRIMTGAMIPSACARIVPFEVCQEVGLSVLVPVAELANTQSYIRHKGHDIKKGQLLIALETRLQADHLLLLTENGCQEVTVYRQPRAAIICTGSELVQAGETPQAGQKISSNGILLASLLRRHHCLPVRSVTVGDKVESVVRSIQEVIAQDKPDLLITTGGMGPGKFDLMEQVFARLGGVPVYHRLKVRPGKSTLFGMIGTIPFFALPGPPPAVRILFHELVVPGLNRLQGLREDSTGSHGLVDAILANPMTIRQTGHLGLKGAVAEIHDGYVQVRPAGQLEPINAIMHLEPGLGAGGKGERVLLNKNQRITVRLVGRLIDSI